MKSGVLERSKLLDEAQDLYQELAYLKNPKMPCPECAGGGSVSGGSLGDICVRCMGERVLDMPGTERLEQPDFAGMRRALTAYADHRGKLKDVPTVAELKGIIKAGEEMGQRLQLGGGSVKPVSQLTTRYVYSCQDCRLKFSLVDDAPEDDWEGEIIAIAKTCPSCR